MTQAVRSPLFAAAALVGLIAAAAVMTDGSETAQQMIREVNSAA